MAGLLSSLGVILRLASNVSDEGVAKGALTTIEDKKVHLLRSDGSMMKLLDKYVVEPVAVVSNDLKDVEELDHILGLHMDMFTGYYMQVFDILRDQYGLSVNVVIDALATDNGTLTRVVTKGLEFGIDISSTESEDMHDYLGDLIAGSSNLSTEASRRRKGKTPAQKKTAATKKAGGVKATLDMRTAEAHAIQRGKLNADKEFHKENPGYAEGESYRKEMGRNRATEEHRKNNPHRKNINRDVVKIPSRLSESHEDLLIPNAIQRTLQITAEVVNKDPGSDGTHYTKTVIIPVTVKLAVIFTSTENILNAIDSQSDSYGFSDRLDDYRSGAISLTDFVLAGDLIRKYKKNKLKDKDNLLQLLKSRELSANTKMISNGFAGYEKFYNMYIISPQAKVSIEKEIRKKLSSTSGKDKFLEQANGLSVTVVDPDYERIQIMVKDIRGKTDLTFKAAIKKDKNSSDYSEIIKALVASKPPAF